MIDYRRNYTTYTVKSILIILFSVTITHHPYSWPGQTSFISWLGLVPQNIVLFLVERNIAGEMAQRGVFLTSTFNKSSQPDFFEVKSYTVSPSRRSDSVFELKIFLTWWDDASHPPRYLQSRGWLKQSPKLSDISWGICQSSSTPKTGRGPPE